MQEPCECREKKVSRVRKGSDAGDNPASRGKKRRQHEAHGVDRSSGEIKPGSRGGWKHRTGRKYFSERLVQTKRAKVVDANLVSAVEYGKTPKRFGKQRTRRKHGRPREPLFATRSEHTEYVRDVVRDYIAGQLDPVVVDCSVRRQALGLESDSPLQVKHRASYMWVVQDSSGHFTHDLREARLTQALSHMPRLVPCDMCGVPCKKSNMFVVRCYARRRPDDADETQRPRIMRPESFGLGQNCMQRLLGKPFVPRTKVAQLPDRLLSSLRIEQSFSVHKFLEPLQKLPTEALKSVSTAFHDVLARAIKHLAAPERAWRQTKGRRAVLVRSRTSATSCTESIGHNEEEALAPAEKISEAGPLAPHELYYDKRPRPPYVIVIPSYGRPERLRTNTLAFLKQQKIPPNRIEIWLAPGKAPGQQLTEEERYRSELAEEWPGMRLKIGVKGIMEQRWHIGLQYPENTHLVSFDDDVPAINYKFQSGTGSDCLQPLPSGAMEAIIHHAHDLMQQEGAWIWGLCASSNPMNMVLNAISRRSGMLNGFMYGWRVRHDPCLRSIYCSPTEDVERSCRYYNKDGILLRYQMYSARTIFKAPDGISLLYSNGAERKAAEEQAIMDIATEFPDLISVRTGDDRRKTEAAMNFRFKSLGLGPLQANGKPREGPPPGRPPRSSENDLLVKAAEEKTLLDRCVALQDEIACPGHNKVASAKTAPQRVLKRDKSSAVDVAKTSCPSAPAVLDEILQVATRGRQKFADLGFKLEPMPSQTEKIAFATDDDIGNESESESSAASEEVPEEQPALAEEDVPPTPVFHKLADESCGSSRRAELPDPSSGAAVTNPVNSIGQATGSRIDVDRQHAEDDLPSCKEDGGMPLDQSPLELEMLVVEDSPVVTPMPLSRQDVSDDVSCWTFRGFRKSLLNTSYYVNQHIKVQGKKTFWEKNEALFLYWQDTQSRWAIAQRWINGEDFLLKIMGGELQGWAYQDDTGKWCEFRDADTQWLENASVECTSSHPGSQSNEAPRAIQILGCHPFSDMLNGHFDLQLSHYNGRPCWRKRDDVNKWLLWWPTGWKVTDSESKLAGDQAGWLWSHDEAPLPTVASTWMAVDGDKFIEMPVMVVADKEASRIGGSLGHHDGGPAQLDASEIVVSDDDEDINGEDEAEVEDDATFQRMLSVAFRSPPSLDGDCVTCGSGTSSPPAPVAESPPAQSTRGMFCLGNHDFDTRNGPVRRSLHPSIGI